MKSGISWFGEFLAFTGGRGLCVFVCVCEHTCTGACTQSCLTLLTPWTVAHQAPLLMEFSRQEYWSGVPLPPLGDLPDAGIEPAPLASPSLAGGFFTASAPLPGRGCPLTREGKPPYQGGCCCSSVTKSCLTLCDSMELQHTRLPCPSLSPWVCSYSCPLSR